MGCYTGVAGIEILLEDGTGWRSFPAELSSLPQLLGFDVTAVTFVVAH